MVFEGQIGPQIVAGSLGLGEPTEEPMDSIRLSKLTNRLFYKVGVGQERPKMELAGPITDEEFPDSKILFFPLILQDPDSADSRIRKHGAISAIYLVFPSQKMDGIYQAYNELSYSLKTFLEEIETTKELIDSFHAVEGIIKRALLRSALNRILDELMLDHAFKCVFVCSTEGTILALVCRAKDQGAEPKVAERIGSVSALSISQRVLEVLEGSKHNPVYISQKENEAIIGLKIPEGGMVGFLERWVVYSGELKKKIDMLRQNSLKISSLLQREAKELELFSLIREQLPEVRNIMLMSKDGVALTSENITGDPQELSGIVSAFFSTLTVSIHDSQEVAVVESYDNFLLLGELQKDIVLLITVPKGRRVDEYIFRMQDLLRSVRKEVDVDLTHYQFSGLKLSEELKKNNEDK